MPATVSIIIPVYNAESTIIDTLESIASENRNSPGLIREIIAVDDGSTDSSLSIMHNWESQLPLIIKQLDHTGSPAKPRNLGIEAAASDFVFFLDADDVLLPGGLPAAVELAVKNESDVVLPRLKSLDGRGVPRGMFDETRSDVTLGNSRIYWALNPMKLIRRSLLNDSSIRFDTNLNRDEDQPFAFKAYLKAKKISILADPPVVGVRYSPDGNNLTLRNYSPDDLFQYLATMTSIMDDFQIDLDTRNFLLIRNWEIEISRELVWKRLPLMETKNWHSTFTRLHTFSTKHLEAGMLPRTSIRWRSIVGLIGTKDFDQLERLMTARKRVLEPKNPLDKLIGLIVSNWIRLRATLILPSKF